MVGLMKIYMQPAICYPQCYNWYVVGIEMYSIFLTMCFMFIISIMCYLWNDYLATV